MSHFHSPEADNLAAKGLMNRDVDIFDHQLCFCLNFIYLTRIASKPRDQ